MKNESTEKKTAEEFWEGFPPDLKEMILDVYHDEGAYSAGQVIERLNAEVGQADRSDASDALTRVAYLDTFLCDCAMDFSCHPDLWEDNREAIAKLLAEADRLLADLERAGAIELRAHKLETADADATALKQRINVYRAVSAALAGDVGEFQERLSRATEDTVANIRYLLASPDANLLVEKEDSTQYGFYLPSQRFFSGSLSLIIVTGFVLLFSSCRRTIIHVVGTAWWLALCPTPEGCLEFESPRAVPTT